MKIIENGANSRASASAAFIATHKDRSECGLQCFQFCSLRAKCSNVFLDDRARRDAGRCRSFSRFQEIADLRYAQPEVARPPNEGKPRHLLRAVGSAARVAARRRRQEADAFIVANGGRCAAGLVCGLTDRKRHHRHHAKFILLLK